MGLDWNPGHKPKPGHEAEFERLFHAITEADEDDSEPLVERFQEISVTAFDTLGAPCVGRDREADDWAREKYREVDPPITEAEWMENMRGFRVLDLVPPCDGLPIYTNGSPGGYVEIYAFRGKFLELCTDVIGDELLEQGFVSKLPAELTEYGRTLLAKAEAYAAEHGVDLAAVMAAERPPDDTDSPEFKLHVVVSAARWCLFWAERGHFLDAYW